MAIDTKLAQAVNAYVNTTRMKGGMSAPNVPGDEPVGIQSDFSQLITEALDKARGAGYAGEVKSAEAVAGEADLQDLIVAVTNAELTLQTVVAVRDRMISAYNDIIKMPI